MAWYNSRLFHPYALSEGGDANPHADLAELGDTGMG